MTEWRCDLLTIFPQMFPGPLGQSLAGKALARGIWSLHAHDIREAARDRHKTVDDTPFGGGAGMVMRPDIVARALDCVCGPDDRRPRIYLTPRGERLTQALAGELARAPGLVALCGRYEGVDQRVIEARGFRELSIGDFVLSGGELAAMVLIDSIVRLLPGVVGAQGSLEEESFAAGLLEYPHYTRPQEWEGRKVPDVLLSGHHEEIRAWRRSMALAETRARRPDLLGSLETNGETRERRAGHAGPVGAHAPAPTVE